MSLAGQNTIVAFLEYSKIISRSEGTFELKLNTCSALTPVRKYPVQHVQATEALRLILEKGFKPSNVRKAPL